MWQQTEIILRARARGFHLITEEICQQLVGVSKVNCGILHLFIKHSSGQLNLGIWQGIYLGEHRDHGGSRKIIATIHGE